MPRIIECSCNHCVGLHHLLRRVSPDLAKKHARKYGLSQPAPPLPHVQPNSAPNEGDFDFDMDLEVWIMVKEGRENLEKEETV